MPLSARYASSPEGQPAAAKREAAPCDDHPDDLRTIRHGTAVGEIAEEYSVPEGRAKSALAPIRRPPSRGGPLHRSASKRPFLLDRARPVFFSARRKENGDSIRCGIAAHLRTNLVRLISQKKSSAFCGGNRPFLREQEPAKGHPGSAAYSCTGDRPAPGSARRWGWRGCGCPPPPRSGW